MKKEKEKIYKDMDEKIKDLGKYKLKVIEHILRTILIATAYTFLTILIIKECLR